MDISFIIVNWNTRDLLQDCLDSIIKTAESLTHEIIVVDNASTDGSAGMVAEKYPQVKIISNRENRGFGAANNEVFKRAKADGVPFVWLLNNDAVPEDDALEQMLAVMREQPQAGAVGSIIYDMPPSTRIQAWGGGRIFPCLGIVRHNHHAGQPLQFLTGASTLFRMEALDACGGFDETFFLYWEDADLCYRLVKAGWRLAVANGRIRHQGSATTNRFPRNRSFHSGRSLHYFYRKHVAIPECKSLTAIMFQSMLKVLTGNFAAAAGFWAGWREGFRVKSPSPEENPPA